MASSDDILKKYGVTQSQYGLNQDGSVSNKKAYEDLAKATQPKVVDTQIDTSSTVPQDVKLPQTNSFTVDAKNEVGTDISNNRKTNTKLGEFYDRARTEADNGLSSSFNIEKKNTGINLPSLETTKNVDTTTRQTILAQNAKNNITMDAIASQDYENAKANNDALKYNASHFGNILKSATKDWIAGQAGTMQTAYQSGEKTRAYTIDGKAESLQRTLDYWKNSYNDAVDAGANQKQLDYYQSMIDQTQNELNAYKTAGDENLTKNVVDATTEELNKIQKSAQEDEQKALDTKLINGKVGEMIVKAETSVVQNLLDKAFNTAIFGKLPATEGNKLIKTVKELTQKEGLKSAGKALNAQTIKNIATAIGEQTVSGTGATYLPFYTRAFGNATLQARNETDLDLAGIVKYGTMVATKEVATELMSNTAFRNVYGGGPTTIDEVISGATDKAVNKIFKEYGSEALKDIVAGASSNFIGEGFEEVVGAFIDAYLINPMYGIDGASWEDAGTVEYLQNTLSDALESFLVGGISGAMMGGVADTADVLKTNDTGNAYNINGKQNKEVVDALVKEGLDANEDSDAYEYAGKIKDKLDNGKTVSSYEVGRLVKANQDAIKNGELTNKEQANELDGKLYSLVGVNQDDANAKEKLSEKITTIASNAYNAINSDEKATNKTRSKAYVAQKLVQKAIESDSIDNSVKKTLAEQYNAINKYLGNNIVVNSEAFNDKPADAFTYTFNGTNTTIPLKSVSLNGNRIVTGVDATNNLDSLGVLQDAITGAGKSDIISIRENGKIDFITFDDFNNSPDPIIQNVITAIPKGNGEFAFYNTTKNYIKENGEILTDKYKYVPADYSGFNVEDAKAHEQQWKNAAKENGVRYSLKEIQTVSGFNRLMDRIGQNGTETTSQQAENNAEKPVSKQVAKTSKDYSDTITENAEEEQQPADKELQTRSVERNVENERRETVHGDQRTGSIADARTDQASATTNDRGTQSGTEEILRQDEGATEEPSNTRKVVASSVSNSLPDDELEVYNETAIDANASWKSIYNSNKKRGINTLFSNGKITGANGAVGNGFTSNDGKTIILNANLKDSELEIVNEHENGHVDSINDPTTYDANGNMTRVGYVGKALNALRDRFGNDAIDDLLSRELAMFEAAEIQMPNDALIEELICDIRAGKNSLSAYANRVRSYDEGLANYLEEGLLESDATDIVKSIPINAQGNVDTSKIVGSNGEKALFSIELPYQAKTKQGKDWIESLDGQAKETYNLLQSVLQVGEDNLVSNYNLERNTSEGIKTKTIEKPDNIAKRFMRAEQWNQNCKENAEFATVAKKLADALPKNIRESVGINNDGSYKISQVESEFKLERSWMQRVLDGLPKETVSSNVVIPDGRTISLSDKKTITGVGGDALRRQILDENRKLYAEGKLKPKSLDTLSKDTKGAMGFLASSGKTGATGDFTTICPNVFFNKGCFYCYRRAQMESGMNNKLSGTNIWYIGDILKVSDADIDAMNAAGGLRIQSSGDWMPEFTDQLVDILVDAKTRGLQVKFITKFTDMIETLDRLKKQGIGDELYFNLSADYVVEKAAERDRNEILAKNPDRPSMDVNGQTWWKRALSVEEANKFRERYDWVNVRIVALNEDEFIRGLRDPRVDVVTGYHGDITRYEGVSTDNGVTDYVEVEHLGDHGMPRFTLKDGKWEMVFEGNNKEQKRLGQAIEKLGLQTAYYAKSCCITGRCASCSAMCGLAGKNFYLKNATNRDMSSFEFWYRNVPHSENSLEVLDEMKKFFKEMYNAGVTKKALGNDDNVKVMLSYDLTPSDAKYLELANNEKKNHNELSKMVEDAAREKGYDKSVYHGTMAKVPFTRFNEHALTWVSESKDYSGRYADVDDDKLMHLYANIGKSLTLPDINEAGIVRENGVDIPTDTLKEVAKLVGTKVDTLITGAKFNPYLKFYEWDSSDNVPTWVFTNTPKFMSLVAKSGYDSVTSRDVEDDVLTYGIVNSARLKSAKDVVYDDNGNVIPLSERFNDQKREIRFSYDLSAQDGKQKYDINSIKKFNVKEEDAKPFIEAVNSLDGVQLEMNFSGKTDEIKTLVDAFQRELIYKGGVSFVGRTFKSADELGIAANVFRDPRYETIRYFFMDENNKVVMNTGFSSQVPNCTSIIKSKDGTLESVRRSMRSMYRKAINAGATSFYVMHNHPSGNPTPSKHDFTSTHVIKSIAKQVGLEMNGHIIIDHNKFTVFNPDLQTRSVQPYTIDYSKGTVDKMIKSIGAINSAETLASYLTYINGSDAVISVYIGATGMINGIQQIPQSVFESYDVAKKTLHDEAIKFGASSTFLLTNNMQNEDILKALYRNTIVLDVCMTNGTFGQMGYDRGYGNGEAFMNTRHEVAQMFDSAPDYGYHAGDLGKSTVDDYMNQSYSRGTGHFGTGTYFVGDENQINIGNYAKRPHEKVDFTKYNLLKIRNDREGYDVHDALKGVDGFVKKLDVARMNAMEIIDKKYEMLNDLDTVYYGSDQDARKESGKKLLEFAKKNFSKYQYDELESRADRLYELSRKESITDEDVNRMRERAIAWREDFTKDNPSAKFANTVDEEVENGKASLQERIDQAHEEYGQMSRDEIMLETRDFKDALESEFDYMMKLHRWYDNEMLGTFRFATGKSTNEIESALDKTAEVASGYKDEGFYTGKYKDSAATVFMKALGYEGVDVRNTGLDNTGYGSVIYDLKGEDLARKNEIGTAKFSYDLGGTPFAELYDVTDDGRVKPKNVKDLSTEDWKLITKAVDRIGYGIGSYKTAKEIYSKYVGENGFNKEQSDAIMKAYGVVDGKATSRNVAREKLAKDTLGTTNDFREAGYLLPDGYMLDFSGKRNGGPRGTRTMDHREINMVFVENEVDTTYGDSTPYMNAFINEGNIRLMESQGVTIGEIEPTDKQYAALSKFIDHVMKNEDGFYLDLSNEGGRVIADRWYPEGTDPRKVIYDIKQYFKNGELPYRSDLQDFRMSYELNQRDRNVILSEKNRELYEEYLEAKKLQKRAEELASKYKADMTTTNRGQESYTKASSNKLLNKIAQEFDSSVPQDKIADAFYAVANDLLRNGDDLTVDEWKEITSSVTNISKAIINNSKVLVSGDTQKYKDAKYRASSTPVKIENADQFKDDISILKKSGRGIINITEDGTSVNELYSKMQQEFGEDMFPNADGASSIDQLERIVSVIKSLKPIYDNPFNSNLADAYDIMTNVILTNIIDGEGLNIAKTKADKWADKVSAQKEKTKQAVQSQKEKDAKKLDDAKAQFKERLESEKERRENDLNKQRAEYQSRLEKLRQEKNAKIDQVTQDAKDRIRNIYEEERAKRRDAVNKVKQHYKEVELRRRARKFESDVNQELLKMIRHMKSLKTTGENKKIINDLIGNIDSVSTRITGRTVQRINDIVEFAKGWQEANEGFIFQMPPKWLETIDRVGKVQISDISLDDKITLVEMLKALNTQIQNDKKFVDSEVRKNKFDSSLQITVDVNGAREYPKSMIAKGYINNMLSGGRVIRRITGYSNSPLETLWNELAVNGVGTAQRFVDESNAMFKEFSEDKQFVKDTTGKNAKTMFVKGYLENEEVPVEMTRGTAMQLFLLSQDPDAVRHIQGGGVEIPNPKLLKGGDKKEAVASGDVYVFSKKQLEAIESQLTDKELKFLSKIFDYYNEFVPPQINRVSETLYGYPVTESKNHVPIHTSRYFFSTDIGNLYVADGAMLGLGWTKERTNSAKTIYVTDVWDDLSRSIKVQSTYIGMRIPSANLSKIWNYSTSDKGEVEKNTGSGTDLLTNDVKDNTNYKNAKDLYYLSTQKSVAKKFGATTVDYITKAMNDVLSHGALNQGSWLIDVITKARGNYAGSVLELNAGVSATQYASYFTAAPIVGYDNLVKAFAIPVNKDAMYKYSPFMSYRSKGFSSIEAGDIALRGKEIPKALNWIQGADLSTVARLWSASEAYVRAKYPTLEIGSDAYYKMVGKVHTDVITETQPNYTAGQRSGFLRDQDNAVRSLVMFKTQLFQQFGLLYDAMGELDAKKTVYKNAKTEADSQKAYDDVKSAAKKVTVAWTSVVLSSALVALIRTARKIVRDDRETLKEDGKLSLSKTLLYFGRETVSSMMSMFLGGTLINNLLSSIIFGDAYYGNEQSILYAFDDIGNKIVKDVNLVKDIAGGEDGDPETIARSVFDSLVIAGQMFGVPLNSIKNNLGAIWRGVSIAIYGKDMGEYWYQRVMKQPSKNSSLYYDMLYDAYKNESDSYEEMYKEVAKELGDDKIKSNMENRMKDDEGVEKVSELSERFYSPEKQSEIDAGTVKLMKSPMYQSALTIVDKDSDGNVKKTDHKEKAIDTWESYVNNKSTDASKALEKKAEDCGIDVVDVIEFQFYKDKFDQQNDNGKYGTYTNKEIQKAIDKFAADKKLSRQQKKQLWFTFASSPTEKNCPY